MSPQRPVVLLGHAHTCPLHEPGTVISGSPVCSLHGRPVARMGDTTDHSGKLIEGHSDWTVE